VLAKPNPSLKRLRLAGLNEDYFYRLSATGEVYSAKELMNRGIVLETEFSGVCPPASYRGKCTSGKDYGDFTSQLMVFHKVTEPQD
jgi:alpha-galactosidase